MKKKIPVSLLINLAILMACVIVNPTVSPAPTAASAGRYYYVSPNGDDANPGTKTLPMQTIGKAAGVAKAGDVVLIQAGIYYEYVTPLYSGEPDKYITYQNAGDGEVVIDAQNGQRAGCIEINNKSYLQFIGLTVRGANSYQTWPRAGISMTDGTHHILLDNITTYNNFVGIMAYGRDQPVSFITVKNSKTFDPVAKTGNLHYGVFFYQKVYDSNIVDNHVAYTLPEDQSYGIEVSTDFPGLQSNGASRIIITGNEVDHNETEGIHTWNAMGVWIGKNYLHDNGATGIQIEDGSENIVVEGNLSENNAQKYEFEAGAWIDGSKNVLVRNNVLRSNKVGLLVTSTDRVIVHDNYVYLNDRGAQNLDNAAGLIVDDSVTNLSVTHNTFYKNGANSAQRGAVDFGPFHPSCSSISFKNNIIAETASILDLAQDSCSGFVSDFNDFFNTRPLVMKWNQSQMDWLTYLTVSGQDVHSLTQDPVFTDSLAFDFSLKPTSPLIGMGTVLAQTTNRGNGKTVIVTAADFFSDGFGVANGDAIVIGNSQANIAAVDYTSHSITLDRAIRWNEGDPVSFPFDGSAPDMGASNTQ